VELICLAGGGAAEVCCFNVLASKVPSVFAEANMKLAMQDDATLDLHELT
jgi:hypothetical protein